MVGWKTLRNKRTAACTVETTLSSSSRLFPLIIIGLQVRNMSIIGISKIGFFILSCEIRQNERQALVRVRVVARYSFSSYGQRM